MKRKKKKKSVNQTDYLKLSIRIIVSKASKGRKTIFKFTAAESWAAREKIKLKIEVWRLANTILHKNPSNDDKCIFNPNWYNTIVLLNASKQLIRSSAKETLSQPQCKLKRFSFTFTI